MTATHTKNDCCEFPDLRRPNYFFGQMLGVREFRGEQSYFREKLKLLNRTLHGWGVVCGLTVSTTPAEEDCEPKGSSEQRVRLEKEIAELAKRAAEARNAGQIAEATAIEARIAALRQELERLSPEEDCDPEPSPTLRVDCGLALDCEGNELVLHRPVEIDPLRYLSKEQRESDKPLTLYVAICYCAKSVEPSRPLQTQDCGITSDCEFGWTVDSVRVSVTTTAPPTEENCNSCCKACDEQQTDCDEKDKDSHACCCVVLAAIDEFVPGRPIDPSRIRNGVRRLLSVYDFVRVSGISWAHGGVYTPSEAKDVLGAEGHEDDDTDEDTADEARGALEVHLTRPVRVSTLQPGVFDVWIIEGGGGRSGNIYHLAGDFILPTDEYTTVIRYRQRSNETLQDGDCVLIMLRSEFVLDKCWRAVAGANTGGDAPPLPGALVPASYSYRLPYPGGWRSGSQSEGSNFISWFFVATESREKKTKKEAKHAQ